jgi:hypothetical protein
LFATLDSTYKQALELVSDAEDSDASDAEAEADKAAAREKVISLKNTLSKLKDNVLQEAAAAK